jgi:dTMP kinase
MKRPIPEGFLIAIEGIDGAGKTSIATMLAQWCGERGLACFLTKEPTGVDFGKTLRESASKGRLSLDDELDLFCLDREHHVERMIAPALDEKSIVITDRYYWSTAAYQGARGACPEEIVTRNEKFAPKPDLFVLLDLPVDVGIQRIRTRGDEPNEFEKRQSLEKARQIFLSLAEQEPGCAVVRADRPLKDVFQEVLMSMQLAAVNKIALDSKARYGCVVPEDVNRTLALFGQPPLEGPAGDVVAA